jgi:hypothetical protein
MVHENVNPGCLPGLPAPLGAARGRNRRTAAAARQGVAIKRRTSLQRQGVQRAAPAAQATVAIRAAHRSTAAPEPGDPGGIAAPDFN